jgi:hypothetical protein
MRYAGSKGQSSFEFVAIIGILFLVVLGSFAFVQSRTYAVMQERYSGLLEGIANIIRSELDMAYDVKGDYYREFILPEVVEGANYSVNMTSNSQDIVLRIEDTEYVVFLNQNLTGSIKKGMNVIRKSGQNISIN